MRTAGYVAVAILTLLFLMGFVVPFFFPWTPLNCTDESIDITSGRKRVEKHFLYMKVADRIEETPLSGAYRELVGEPGQPDWRRVNTFSPGVSHSPHYIYHSALISARQLTEAFGSQRFTDRARKQAVLTFLGLLQSEGNDGKAGDYAWAVFSLACDAKRRDAAEVDVGDLPQRPRGGSAPPANNSTTRKPAEP